MAESIEEAFGDAASFDMPQGGIFMWLTFPEDVDTGVFGAEAARKGIQFNAGAGWSGDPEWGANKMRLCFGNPSADAIREGVKELAEIMDLS